MQTNAACAGATQAIALAYDMIQVPEPFFSGPSLAPPASCDRPPSPHPPLCSPSFPPSPRLL